MLADLFGDAADRPHLGGITRRQRAPFQQTDQFLLLVRWQLRRTARRGPRLQARLPLAPEGLHPAHERTYGRLNHAGHRLIRVTLFQKRHRLGASRLQLSGRAFGSHEPHYATIRKNSHYLCEAQYHVCYEDDDFVA
jgi:hypothetical protein